MFRRITSFLLSLAMVLSMVPAKALATETEPAQTVPETVAETVQETAAETEATVPETTEPASTVEETEVSTAPAAEETVPQPEPTELPMEPAETAPESTVPEETVVETEPVMEEAEAAAAASGTCGDDLTWEFSGNTLKISGSGPMYDYEKYNEAPWYSYNYKITKLTLPKGLTTIGKYAFSWCEFTNVEIPDTVERIHKYAFYETQLKKAVIPLSVQYIDTYAFDGCYNLWEIKYAGSREDFLRITGGENQELEAGNVHFAARSSDTELAGGTCGYNLLWSLDKSYKLTISCIRSNDSGEFSDRTMNYEIPWYNYATLIVDVSLPEGLYNIGACAFINLYKLKHITIPDTVYTIGVGAFKNCKILEEINLPPRLYSIGNSAFYQCEKLTQVSLPDTLKKIGNDAFAYCKSLTQVVLPDTVTSIGENAFERCSALAYVVLPESLTAIQRETFSYCTALTGISIPESITSVGVYAFSNCKSLTGIVIPKNVTLVDNFAFEYCENLAVVIMTGGVTEIGSYAFRQCKNLKSVSIPASVTAIGNGAFYGCANLMDVYFGGTEAQWNDIGIGSSNTPLLNAHIHFGGGETEPVRVKEVRYYRAWEESTGRVFFGDDMLGCMVTKETSESFRTDPEALLGSYVMVEVLSQWGMETLISMEPVETKVGYVSSADSSRIVIDGVIYDTPDDLEDPEFYAGKYVQYYLYNGSVVGMERMTLAEYVDNNAIVINGSGSAFAYYLTAPLQTVRYCVNGTEGTTKANEKGVFCIPLGTFRIVHKHPVTVEILQVGSITYEPALELDATVTVKAFSFSEKWELSFSAAVGVAANLGLPSETIKATLGKASLKAGGGAAISVSMKHEGDKDTMEITRELSGEVEAGFKVGPQLETEKKKYSIADVSAKTSGTVTSIYGMQFDLYSEESDMTKQRKAIATFLLGEILREKENSILYRKMYESIKDDIYEDSGAVFIYGRGAGLSGSVGGKALPVKVNDKAVFTTTSVGLSATASFDKQENTLGERERESSYQVKGSLDVFAVDVKKNDVKLEAGALLGWDILGADTSVKAKNELSGDSLEVEYLSAEASGVSTFFLDKRYTSVYRKLTLQDEILDYLTDTSYTYRSFVAGYTDMLAIRDVVELAAMLSDNPHMIPYSEKTKQQVLYVLPISIGLGLGIEADMDLELSYLESAEYTSAMGVAVDDTLVITSQSDDYTQKVLDEHTGIPELVLDSMNAIVNEVVEFFETTYENIKIGAKTTWAWITGKPESRHDRRVSITSARGGGGGHGHQAWATSYTVDTRAAAGARTVVPNGITGTASGNYTVSRAVTVGRPFVISVTDNATGESIADFSDDPLEFTIRYAAEDLEAAGLSRQSDVVLDGGIAMYLYNDEGDYFEYVGGTNDLDAMTVTARITRSGQYVLAVDGCAPALRTLDLSDFRKTPTITAQIDDLSGLDVSKFVFMLDGQVKVTGANVKDHYNSEAGLFTYKVTQALSEGEHTLFFTLADTTGNSETYEYSFFVDLTAPAVSDVTVSGYTNEGSAVKIRAKVTDETLTAVYALLSKKLSDGTWTEEVGVAMGDMGDGCWGLDYEGDGSVLKVRICAADIAENTAYSAVFEAKAYVESVELPQDYLALRVGQTLELTADVKPAQLAGSVSWKVEKGGESVISVDSSGKVTARKAGTAYVLATATDGEKTVTARCRIDVAQSLKLDDVRLSNDNLTVEVYSRDYAKLDILLMLPQNYAAAADTSVATEKLSAAISEAYFTDEDVRDLFALRLLDDRTVEIVPTAAAIGEKKPEKRYSGTVTVVVEGVEYVTEPLTLNVRTSLPKLKATVADLNAFWPQESRAIRVTGATVTGISVPGTMPEWLTISNGELMLTEKAPEKNVSAKVTLEIETEEWAVPIFVAVSVRSTYKAPGLKLSASGVQLSDQAESSTGVKLQLIPSNKKESLTDLRVQGITVPEGYRVEDYEDGSFVLKAQSGFVPGKISLEVQFKGTDKTLKLPLTVKTVQTKLKTDKTAISLNGEIGDSALIGITATPADYILTAPSFRLVDGAGNDKLASGELDVRFESGMVRVSTTDKTPVGGNYTLAIRAGGSKEASVKIKILDGTPSLSLKQTRDLDLSFPDQTAVITPVYKNYAGGSITGFRYSVKDSKTGADVTASFAAAEENGLFHISCTDPGKVSEKGAYVLNLELTLAEGKTCEASVKLKVRRTAIKLKLTASKVMLNKTVGDSASVGVTCTTKGYEFKRPVWYLFDKSGKQPMDGRLDISWNNGVLKISPNGATEFGATYKLTVAAAEGAAATALTVTIPAESKSAVTATLKAKGSLDVIRQGSILVTPTYKNCMPDTARTEKLRVVRSDDRIVTEQFCIVKNGDGTYEISIAEGAQIDLTQKYQVQMEATFGGVTVNAKPANFTIRMGSAKLTAKTEGTLFTKDRNSRVNLHFESGDAALNAVARVEIKDAKQAELFEIFDYGSGGFAIGFRGGKAVESAKPITLTLNVFLEGNTGTKPNATVKLKLTIVP